LPSNVARLDTELAHQLFATPPDEFVATRNALVKQLKGDGDRESAATVAAMRRPAWTDWALNVVAAEDTAVVDRWAEAAAEMRDAQRAAFAGRDVDLRGAINQLRDRAGELARSADKVLKRHRRPSALADITERLGEVAADETASERLRTGTLIDAGSDGDDPFAAITAEPTRSRPRAQAKSRTKAATKTKTEPATERSAKPTAKATDRAGDRRRAERELKEAERVHRLVNRDLGRADSAVRQASKVVETATEALAQAEANLTRAQERQTRAEADREAVQRRLEQAERELERARRAITQLGDS
jgi:DNA repair exonuclease SbcCD ATPase subunit